MHNKLPVPTIQKLLMLLDIKASFAWITFIDSVKWPGIILIIAIIAIAVFRKPLTAFLFRSKGFKFGKFQIDSEPSHNQQAIKKNETKTILENATQIFRPETYDFFRGIVQHDTNFANLGSDNEKFEALLKYSVTLCILSRCEAIYYNIFGSQIALLQELNSTGKKGLGIFEHYYNYAKANYPGSLDHISLEDYSGFLYSWDLITNVQNNGIEITTLGIDFLKYLVDARKNIFLPF